MQCGSYPHLLAHGGGADLGEDRAEHGVPASSLPLGGRRQGKICIKPPRFLSNCNRNQTAERRIMEIWKFVDRPLDI
jgi:hypothetical protein